jgi:hypothetical protein
MDVTKPYEFLGFGAMDVTKPYEFGFGAMDDFSLVFLCWPGRPGLGGGRERPGRRPIRPGQAGNPHPRPGPKENHCGWNRFQIRQIALFDEIDAQINFCVLQGLLKSSQMLLGF